MITEYPVLGGMQASGLEAEDAGVLVRPDRKRGAVWIEAWDDAGGHALVNVSAEDAAALARHILDTVEGLVTG